MLSTDGMEKWNFKTVVLNSNRFFNGEKIYRSCDILYEDKMLYHFMSVQLRYKKMLKEKPFRYQVIIFVTFETFVFFNTFVHELFLNGWETYFEIKKCLHLNLYLRFFFCFFLDVILIKSFLRLLRIFSHIPQYPDHLKILQR